MVPCTTTYTKRCVTEGMVRRDCWPEAPQPAEAAAAKLQPNTAHEAGQPKPANTRVLMGVKPTVVHVSSSSGKPSGALPRSITRRWAGVPSVESPVAPHSCPAGNSATEPTGTFMKPVEPRVPLKLPLYLLSVTQLGSADKEGLLESVVELVTEMEGVALGDDGRLEPVLLAEGGRPGVNVTERVLVGVG